MFRVNRLINGVKQCNRINKLNVKCLTSDSKTIKASFPDSADVVIIGGGSAGCHALYHLAKRGVKAVLLERSKLTSGTTWHTAGLIWRLRPNDVDIQLLSSSIKLMNTLEAETGYNSGFINNGGIFIAHNENRLNEYRRLSTIGNAIGIENSILTAEETQKLFPLLNPKSFLGALHSPGDGVVDPAMLCTALTKGATSNGAIVIEDCPVLDIITGDGIFGSKKVEGVKTAKGTIKTNVVVNATGVWGRDLIEKHGVHLPLIPMRHAYIVSEPIEGIQGMPNIRDHDASIYFRIQGSSICMGGYENNPIVLDKVPDDFQFGLYDLDWSTFEEHVKGAGDLCPAFEKAGIKSTICGPESFTPDHKPIMGPDPRLDGLFHSCGFNSAGMMFGGGCGEQLAHWIIHGRPEFHMFGFDIRRFSPQQTENTKWAIERSHEAYAKNYSTVFLHDQPLSGRNLVQDPLHDIMIENGAVMEERHGWERPGYFLKKEKAPILPYDWYGYYGNKKHPQHLYEEKLLGDCKYEFSDHHQLIGEEALNCRKKASLINISYFCKLYLTGPQAKDAADYIFTADTNKESNKLVYTCALNDFGGVESDLTVTVIKSGSGQIHDPEFEGKGYYIVAGGSSAYQTYAHLQSVIREKQFNVQLRDVTDAIGVISIQGPKSKEILQKITNFDLSDKSLPPYMSSLLTVKTNDLKDRCPVRALRLSFVGELGYELHIPAQSCGDVYRALSAAGKSYGIRDTGYRAFYSLSCEKGYHMWGFDLRSDDTPIESNLGFVCRRTGDYKGKAAVERQRNEGIYKRLVYLTLDEPIPLWGLEGVYRNGSSVGHVRRAEYAYTLDKMVAKAYIRHPTGELIDPAYLRSGKYEIDILGKKYGATCHLKSPFDPENNRILGKYS